MNRRFLIGCILIVRAFNASAQVYKKFFNKDGKEIKDSVKAFIHALYQKAGSDSSWSAVILDMHNIPMQKGTYLDSDLIIPYGKFVYYQPLILQSKVDSDHSKIDTTFVVRETGFYVNGKREGTWLDYYANGKRESLKNYENDILNGLYESYYRDGKVFERGYLVNGSKEGNRYSFRTDSTIYMSTEYKHNYNYVTKEYGKNNILYSPTPGYNFEYYVLRFLRKKGLSAAHGSVVVSFTITEKGRLVKPEIKMGVNPTLDKAIIEALNNCPAWVPGKLNNKTIDQTITLGFDYDNK